ncbi:MAG: hypothetical protein MZV70_62630 [Desulfobacterales bacterium]|nr:hypothetical protein [Desulfobacterales bacterium]
MSGCRIQRARSRASSLKNSWRMLRGCSASGGSCDLVRGAAPPFESSKARDMRVAKARSRPTVSATARAEVRCAARARRCMRRDLLIEYLHRIQDRFGHLRRRAPGGAGGAR